MTPSNSVGILLIDDEVVLGRLYVSVLREEGYDAYLATSVEEAEEVLRKISPSVILVDCRMPLISGEECVAHLKEKFPEHCESALLVGFSSFEPDMKVVDTFRSVVDRLVRKPDDIEVFVSLIRELVAESRAVAV